MARTESAAGLLYAPHDTESVKKRLAISANKAHSLLKSFVLV